MSFPNSEKGLKRIFNAMVTSLIATGVMIISLIGGFIGIASTLISTGVSSSDSSTIITNAISSLLSSGVILLVILLAAIIALIVAAVLEIIGIVNCSKDDPAFKSALYILISYVAFIVISVVLAASNREVLTNTLFYFLFGLIVTVIVYAFRIFLVKGIISLANQLQNKAMESKGNNIVTLLIWTGSINIAASLMKMITSLTAIAGIISFVGGVMSIVVFIMFFIFIKKGKDMLANAHD